jgi:hypothetical protein
MYSLYQGESLCVEKVTLEEAVALIRCLHPTQSTIIAVEMAMFLEWSPALGEKFSLKN